MKPRHSVMWSEIAEKDLIAVIEYIANDSPSRAYEIFKDIKKKASTLHSFPERGRIVPEFREHGITQYRELIVGPWRIIYRAINQHVYVLSVLDSRRNLEDLLLQRFIGQKL